MGAGADVDVDVDVDIVCAVVEEVGGVKMVDGSGIAEVCGRRARVMLSRWREFGRLEWTSER